MSITNHKISETNRHLEKQTQLILQQQPQSIQCSACLSHFRPSKINYCAKCGKTICIEHTYSGCCSQCHSKYFKGTCSFTQRSIEKEYQCKRCNRGFCQKHLYDDLSVYRNDECSNQYDYSKRFFTPDHCMRCHQQIRQQGKCELCETQSNCWGYYFNCHHCNKSFCSGSASKGMNLENNRFQKENVCKNCESYFSNCVIC